jgi:hypothetical protein
VHNNLYFSFIFNTVVGRYDSCEHLPPTQNYITCYENKNLCQLLPTLRWDDKSFRA